VGAREEARRFARRLHALGGGAEVRRKVAARELAARPAAEVIELLHHLIALSRGGWEPAGCVLSSLVAALRQEAETIPHLWALGQLASARELSEVAGLFVAGPARKALDLSAAKRGDAQLFVESLGHLKTKARATRNPDEIARLATASEPSVMANLLKNPRLTEEVVVRVAARRPARPEPLIEIWKSVRWSARRAVRRALVFNPYLPPDVGAKIVPLLGEGDWRELAKDAGVHPELREQARRLLGTTQQERSGR
jgi:hypothetical protein